MAPNKRPMTDEDLIRLCSDETLFNGLTRRGCRRTRRLSDGTINITVNLRVDDDYRPDVRMRETTIEGPRPIHELPLEAQL